MKVKDYKIGDLVKQELDEGKDKLWLVSKVVSMPPRRFFKKHKSFKRQIKRTGMKSDYYRAKSITLLMMSRVGSSVDKQPFYYPSTDDLTKSFAISTHYQNVLTGEFVFSGDMTRFKNLTQGEK